MSEAPLRVMVRRGAADRFRLLEEMFVGEAIAVTWDLRTVERRRRREAIETERRQRERRGRSEVIGYVLECPIVRPIGP